MPRKSRKPNKYREPRQSRKGYPEQTGGHRFGKGTYGIVMGEPRLRCVGEDPSSNQMNEVSKHFLYEKHALDEHESITNFYKDLAESDQVIISETTILPIKICMEKLEVLKTDERYDESWGRDEFNAFVDKRTDEDKRGMFMVIYPKADYSLGHEIDENITNIQDGMNILENIAKAIVIFHKNNYTHRDIKLANCVVRVNDDGGKTSAIIDMADIQKI
jgi:serine/threonine protein kinase